MRTKPAAFALAALLFTAATATAGTTPIGELRRGSMATVAGTVDRILDTDEFRLRDASGAIRVYVGPNWVPVEVGERVTVRGRVDDGLWMELYAREITMPDGRVVRFSHRYE